jgi:hypothetical protein
MEHSEIFIELTRLAEQHKLTGDDLEDVKDSDSIEMDAWEVVYQYCLDRDFKTPQKFLENKPVFDDDNTFGEKKWFIDTLIVSSADVSEISYHLVSQFWPEEFSSKEDYIESVIEHLESPDLFY